VAPIDLGGSRAVAGGEGVSMAAPAFSWWFEGWQGRSRAAPINLGV